MLINTEEQKGPAKTVEEAVDSLEQLAKTADKENTKRFGSIRKAAGYGLGLLVGGLLVANTWMLYSNASLRSQLKQSYTASAQQTAVQQTSAQPAWPDPYGRFRIKDSSVPQQATQAQPVSYQSTNANNLVPAELVGQKLTIDTKAEASLVQNFVVQHTRAWASQLWDSYMEDYAPEARIDTGKAVLDREGLKQYKMSLNADIEGIDLGEGKVGFRQQGNQIIATITIPQEYRATGYADSGIKQYTLIKTVGEEYKIISESFTPTLK